MTLAVYPPNTRDQIEEIIGMVGRDVTFYYVYSSQACPNPNDSLDPTTNTSTNSFCPICSGTYWIDIYSGVTMSAHVTWKYDFENEFTTGGRIFNGDARVKVMHTAERETIVKETKYLVVDDKVMNVQKTTLLGTPINRIIVDVKEKEE